jgi:inorganic pyrophosphatase
MNNITTKNENNIINFYNNNNPISPWNDIPLKIPIKQYYSDFGNPWNESLLNKEYLYNFICEIPKWTRKKYEINKEHKYHSIIQDTINNKPREYDYGDIFFNYGALPQTFEDPNVISKLTNLKGDNDPLDVIEIGLKQIKVGEIKQVKVLGIIPLIDDNETDWKVIAISSDDILFDKLYNINDVEREIPNLLNSIINWFVNYKKNINITNYIGMNGKIQDKYLAEEIINENYLLWKKYHS